MREKREREGKSRSSFSFFRVEKKSSLFLQTSFKEICANFRRCAFLRFSFLVVSFNEMMLSRAPGLCRCVTAARGKRGTREVMKIEFVSSFLFGDDERRSEKNDVAFDQNREKVFSLALVPSRLSIPSIARHYLMHGSDYISLQKNINARIKRTKKIQLMFEGLQC